MQYKKIGEICEIEYGKRVVQSKDGGSIYPVYGGGGATFKMDMYNRENCMIISRFAMSAKCTRFVQGRFFLNDSGLSLKANTDIVLQSYLDKAILALNDDIYRLGKGCAQKNLDMKAFVNLRIQYPNDKATQSRIVSELDLLTSLIDNQKKQLDELSKLQQSTFYSMFGDPVENEKEWPVKKLGEVCEFKNGINFNKVDNGGNEYTFLGVSDFKDNVCIYSEQLGVINIEEKITDDYFLDNNDIVFVRSNGSKDLVGRAVLIKVGNEKVTYSGFCIRCRIVSDINSLFLIWLLKYPTIKDCLTNAGRGCNISNVNQKVLNNLLLPLPPLPLQTAFAEKISAIEEMKKNLKASIAETQKLFDARMQEIFG